MTTIRAIRLELGSDRANPRQQTTT